MPVRISVLHAALCCIAMMFGCKPKLETPVSAMGVECSSTEITRALRDSDSTLAFCQRLDSLLVHADQQARIDGARCIVSAAKQMKDMQDVSNADARFHLLLKSIKNAALVEGQSKEVLSLLAEALRYTNAVAARVAR